jgi:ferredoxin|tara:strand:+ start:450 stop:683 length:234 start_codon:yes stop_codon:yes gene_type:complete
MVIEPNECIDCGVCEPVCPVDAIFPDTDLPEKDPWLHLNAELAKTFTNITQVDESLKPADAADWADVKDKIHLLDKS